MRICELSARHEEPVPANPRLAVCDGCRAHLVRLLDDIAHGWPVVLTRVIPLRRGRSFGVLSKFGPSSPVNDHVLALTDWRTSLGDEGAPLSIPAILGGWVGVMKEERGVRPAERYEVTASLRYLADNIDYLCGADWIADAAHELAAIARVCRRFIGGDGGRVAAVRPCPGTELAPCEGGLRPSADSRYLECDRCGRGWASSEWLSLADENQRPVLASTQDIAVFYGIPEGTIKRWASLEHWPRYGTRSRRLYALEDAQRTYETRRDRRTG